MNDSITIGLVIGGGVALITGYISHWFRLREMKIQSAEERERLEALWAEEERRRKSDRRREIWEGMLEEVSDAVDAVLDVRMKLTPIDRESRLKLAMEVLRMLERGRSVVHSLEDPELDRRFFQLYESYSKFQGLFDFDAGMPKEGKDKEFGQCEHHIARAASKVRGRIREILEEV